MSDAPFQIDVGRLKKIRKDTSVAQDVDLDNAADELGFVEREPKKRRGRKPSPRTGQVHAKVLPNVSKEISEEAKRRGVQQGVLIEESWELYKNR